MTLLSQLERVPPELMVFAVVAVLLMVAVLVLVFGWRNSSDNKAKARAQAVPTVRLPEHMATRMWDFDEKGRTW